MMTFMIARAILGAMFHQTFRRPQPNHIIRAVVVNCSESHTSLQQDDVFSALSDCTEKQWKSVDKILNLADPLTQEEGLEMLRHLSELNYTISDLRRSELLCASLRLAVFLRRTSHQITSSNEAGK